MNLIAAADERWGIGKEGGLLANLPGDMKYFRETTKGKTVVMGRKTLESFPGGRPLKNRTNLVLSRNKDYAPEGVTVYHTPEEAIDALKKMDPEEVFVIGGGTIYRQLLPWCNKAYITHIYASFEADTTLPDLEDDPEWELKEQSPCMEENGLRYDFRIYTRVSGGKEQP